MTNDAIFEYHDFDNYFNSNNKRAFFIKEQITNKLLGLVMLDISSNVFSIKEFMVIPKYRKNKIGKKIAFECFNMYKGNWKVSPSFGSEIAYNFWKSVIDEYTNKNNKFIDGTFIFNNK